MGRATEEAGSRSGSSPAEAVSVPYQNVALSHRCSMQNDTDLGGPGAAFPTTHISVVAATGSSDPEVRKQAYATLTASYWKPIYKYIRIKWNVSNEDAKDLTQSFLAQVMEKPFLDRYEPAVSRFRTYLRTCVDRFVANEQKSAGRIKRGGAMRQIDLDFEGAERELGSLERQSTGDSEEIFYREWVRQLFEQAVEGLRRQCDEGGNRVHFALFESYDLTDQQVRGSITYAELSERFGLAATQVTNYLAWARRQFRTLVLDALRRCTENEEEFQIESARLFGERQK
jgi:RNA polymerase sigma factor (sigma-70 family)